MSIAVTIFQPCYIISYLCILSTIMFLSMTCSKPRPSKDAVAKALKNDKKIDGTTPMKDADKKAMNQEPPRALKTVEKDFVLFKPKSKESAEKLSTDGKPSKEALKTSNSSDDGKKQPPHPLKASASAEGTRVSNRVDTKKPSLNKKGSQEVPSKDNGLVSEDKHVNDYDRHRARTPGILLTTEGTEAMMQGSHTNKGLTTDDANVTLSKWTYENLNPTSNEELYFKAPTEHGESIQANVTNLKPQQFEKDEKQKKIEAGLRKRSKDYPTMDDIISDWSDSKDAAGKKKLSAEPLPEASKVP